MRRRKTPSSRVSSSHSWIISTCESIRLFDVSIFLVLRYESMVMKMDVRRVFLLYPCLKSRTHKSALDPHKPCQRSHRLRATIARSETISPVRSSSKLLSLDSQISHTLSLRWQNSPQRHLACPRRSQIGGPYSLNWRLKLWCAPS